MIKITQYYKIFSNRNAVFVFILLQFTGTLVFSQTARFSYIKKSNCAPAVAQFINESSVNPSYKFMWDFDKGAVIFSDKTQLEEVFAQTGTYHVVLALINGTDTIRTAKDITFFNGPAASFSVSPGSGCAPVNVSITNSSLQGDASINNYFWDLRNGETRSSQNINYTYTQPGSYGIFFKVTDANGCSDFIDLNNQVTVNAQPEVNFTASSAFGCTAPLITNFINQTTGSADLQYNWDFGNGTTSTATDATVIYSNTGSYNVSLTASTSNGCSAQLTKESFIVVGEEGDLYARQDNNDYYYNLDTLCPGEIRFVASLGAYSGNHWSVNYNNIITNYTAGNTLTLNFPDSGHVTVTFISGPGTECPDSITKTYIIDHITSGFDVSPETACSFPVQLNFTDQSDDAISWLWTLPDGSSSALQNPSYFLNNSINSFYHLYNHEINIYPFDITQQTTSFKGCTSTTIKTYEVNYPVARFMPDTASGCAPLTVTFTDKSKSEETITTWTYIIDGINYPQSNNNQFVHTFNTPGIYDVYLSITNSSGCSDTSYRVRILVGDTITPDISFSPSTVCYGDETQITNNTVTSYPIDSWRFISDGLFNISDGPSPTIKILPSSTGVKNVIAEAVYNGCASSVMLNDVITVNGPVGNFDYALECINPYDYTFISGISGYTSLTWTINGATIYNEDTVKYTFPARGDYVITLGAANSLTSCSIARSRTVKVREVNAVISVNPIACRFEPVLFYSRYSQDFINECYNEGFMWDFNDNTRRNRIYPDSIIHIFTEEGKFRTVLEVTDDNGCKDTTSILIQVFEPDPAFMVSPETGCSPELEAVFTNTSTDTTINSWRWYFGDYSVDTSNHFVVSHTYFSAVSKTYLAVFDVTDIYGCKNLAFKEVEIYKPISQFYAMDNSLCVGNTVNLVKWDNSITSYEWDFGDGTTSNSNGNHIYSQPGNYDIKLTVTDKGCTDSLLRNDYISIEQASAQYNMNAEIFDCYPATATFSRIISGSPLIDGIWSFGNGLTSSSFNETANFTYTDPGTYNTSLTVRTLNGCMANYSRPITVNGPTAAINMAPSSICYGGSVNFSLIGANNVDSYTWIFGDGETSAQAAPVHQYRVRGAIIPSVRLTNNVCEVIVTGSALSVSNVEAGFDVTGPVTNHCKDQYLYVQNTSMYYNSSSWRINNTEVATLSQPPGLLFSDLGINNLDLIVSDGSGCSDTASMQVTVVAGPGFSIEGDDKICKGLNAANLNATSGPGWTISWAPTESISGPYSFTTQANPESTTTYNAIVTDANGCYSLEMFTVMVVEPDQLVRDPADDTSIFIGESIQLYVESFNEDASYTWSPVNQISCKNCNNPIASPTENRTYTVQVKDECYDISVDFLIEVIIDFYLEAPKAFTPNGDGDNDIFCLKTKNIAEFKDFKIFNRWGNIVFETNNVNECWDGVYRDKLQNMDTYIWYVTAITTHGYEFQKKGSFVLLK